MHLDVLMKVSRNHHERNLMNALEFVDCIALLFLLATSA